MAFPQGRESLKAADPGAHSRSQTLFLDRGAMLAWVILVAAAAWLFVAVFAGISH